MSILIEFANSTLDKPISWDNVFKVIGFIGSAIAFFWTVASGLKTFKNAANDKRDKQISEYISLFADKNGVKRISGVNGLVRHINLTFNELFYICATEKDSFIRELIHDALENTCINKKADCVKNNKFLVQYCLKKNILPLKLPGFNDKERLLGVLRRGNTETRIEIEINSGNRSLLYNDTAEIRNYMALSSQLLAKSLSKVSNEHLKGVMFVDSSLYGAIWKKCRLENAALLHNIGRHAKGTGNIIGEVYLWDNDFYGSEFTDMDCCKIYSYNTHLRNSVFKTLSIRGTRYPSDKKSSTANLQRSVFEKNIFNMSKFYSVKIEDCNMMKVEWKGCTLEDVSFASMMIKENDWSGTKAVRCSFIHIGFYASKFHSEFLQCNFEDVKWGGNNLRGTKFKECTFKKVNFKGTDMDKVLFENCTFVDGKDFTGAKNSDHIVIIKNDQLGIWL